MNARFTFTLLLLLTAFLQGASAQTPFWSEDFANGIPNGWTNVDANNYGALWTWCSDPAAGSNEPGCPSIWNDAVNGQSPFAATTAANGFVTMDSDEVGQIPGNHLSELTTSAINCSGKNVVYISFETHIGVYTIDASEGAVLRVSTDKVNWLEYTVFPGLTTSERWSANPEKPIIDISEKAANQATVYIQWQWDGNYEYQWSLDDVKLYDENPTPLHDLAISNFFYTPSSYAQPASQIATDTFFFFARVSNRGALAQTNVKLTAEVREEDENGAVLFSTSTTLPILEPGVTDSIVELPDVFAPELPVGAYYILYSLSADSIDLRPIDNKTGDPFLVTNAVFSKEIQPENAFRPGGDYADGNLYTMGKNTLEQYKAVGCEFAYTTPNGGIAPSDVIASIYLFRVNDDVPANFSDFDDADFFSTDLTWKGIAIFDAPDDAIPYQLHAVELLDESTNQPGVLLDAGARYFLVIEYINENNVVFHAYNDDVAPEFVSHVLYSGQWYTGGYTGFDDNCVMRMYIDLVTTTDEQPLPSTAMTVFPNPVQDQLNLKVSFDKPTNATITVADINGRVIFFENREGLTEQQLSYQLPNLAAGTYLARIATLEGTLTKKFVKQ